MGTDIHMAVEVRRAGKWRWVKNAVACSDCDGKAVVKYGDRPEEACFCARYKYRGTEPGRSHGYKDRNYDAFGVLADVRNGTWGQPTPVIAEARGLPDDLDPELLSEHEAEYDEDNYHYGLGDHTFSWLTLDELLAFDWKGEASHTAFVAWEVFKKWDRRGPPEEYAAGVGGQVLSMRDADTLIKLHARPEAPHTYVEASWGQDLSGTVGNFHSKFIPQLIALAEREGVPATDLRIVFGFDS